MPAGVYEGALQDPATRQWCERRRKRAKALLVVSGVMALPGWALVFALVDTFLFSAPLWPLYPLEVLTLAALVLSQLWSGRVRRYRRILEVYPWQRQAGVARVATNGVPFFKLPVPEDSGTSVSIRARFPDVRRWRRLVARQPKREVWFAGDPRIGGVVALPGPRGLSLALQGGSVGAAERVRHERGGGPAVRSVSDEALERARAAGFGDAEYLSRFS